MAGAFLDATDPWIRWDWFWRHVPDFEARLIEDFKTPVVVGTVLSIALALTADLGLAGVEQAITPWARARAT